MSDLDAFVLSLWAEPADGNRRLVFADLLADLQDPREQWVRAAPDTWAALVPFGVAGEHFGAGAVRSAVVGYPLGVGDWSALSVSVPLKAGPHGVRLPAATALHRFSIRPESWEGGNGVCNCTVRSAGGVIASVDISPRANYLYAPPGGISVTGGLQFAVSGGGELSRLHIIARFPAPPITPRPRVSRKRPATA